MANEILKVGFMFVLGFVILLFLNQMPDFMSEWANYIVLMLLLFFGGIFIIVIKR